MFNWSWRLRSQENYLTPEGPNFNSAPWKHLYLDGTHIKIKLPRQRTALPAAKRDTNGAYKISELKSGLYERNGIHLRHISVMARRWDFYGPLFTGSLGRISMTAVIVSPENIPEGLNYFHPRALEAGVADFLTAAYGDDFSVDGKEQTWHAPVNWRSRTDLPCLAARFDAVNTIVECDGPNCFLVMPLTKTHFLKITCEIGRNVVLTEKKPEPTIDEWIDIAPMLKLANEVLDSVQVTLSPQAQADQEEALRGLSDKSLVKEYPPIKWVAPPIEIDENWRDKYSA